MGTFRLPGRRVIFAGGFVFAIVVVPTLATFAGPTAYTAPSAIAQPTECDNGETMDVYSLECVPEVAPGGAVTSSSGNFVSPAPVVDGGAPSEEQLTETNPGIASPESPVGGDGHR